MNNLENKYNLHLAEKVEEIRRLCSLYKIPCFMAFAVKQGKDGEFKTKSVCMLPELFGIETKDTRFSDFVNIQNGFTAVPKPESQEQALLSEEMQLPEMDFPEWENRII